MTYLSEAVSKHYNLLMNDKSWQVSDDEERRAEIHFALEMLSLADQRGGIESAYQRVLRMLQAGK